MNVLSKPVEFLASGIDPNLSDHAREVMVTAWPLSILACWLNRIIGAALTIYSVVFESGWSAPLAATIWLCSPLGALVSMWLCTLIFGILSPVLSVLFLKYENAIVQSGMQELKEYWSQHRNLA